MKEAILNTRHGGIEIAVTGGGWQVLTHELNVYNEDDSLIASVTLQVPDADAPDEATCRLQRFSRRSAEEMQAVAKLCAFTADLLGLLNDANAEAIAKVEQEEAEAEQRRQEEREAEEVATREREEILMQELVGERVKVRHRSYKTMCYGTVHVTGDGSEHNPYRPRIRYSDQGDTRDSGVHSYRRLDAKTERGWRTVWDDGKDDLPEYDRGIKLPPIRPYN